MINIDTIICSTVPENERTDFVDRLFGLAFPLQIEPLIFTWADRLSSNYQGGYWEFYRLTNGGFFMAPTGKELLTVECPNGFTGKMSPHAFGGTCCLYAYSHLSFHAKGQLQELISDQYYWLRDYSYCHPEAEAIIQAGD